MLNVDPASQAPPGMLLDIPASEVQVGDRLRDVRWQNNLNRDVYGGTVTRIEQSHGEALCFTTENGQCSREPGEMMFVERAVEDEPRLVAIYTALRGRGTHLPGPTSHEMPAPPGYAQEALDVLRRLNDAGYDVVPVTAAE